LLSYINFSSPNLVANKVDDDCVELGIAASEFLDELPSDDA